MTHKDVDKMLRPPRGSALARGQQREEWVIKTRFRPSMWSPYGGSDVAYWGRTRDRSEGLTPYLANASRYDSENSALYEAYSLKEGHWIDDFTVEKLPTKPRLKSDTDTGGGRA
jgi:hypothetical protein